MNKKFQKENVKERDVLGEVGVDGKLVLKRMLRNLCVKIWTEFI
jgi:hypothetical protein